MNAWVAAIILTIVAGTLYSYYKQLSFSIVVTVVCVASFALLLLSAGDVYYGRSETMYQLAFFTGDLTDLGRLYTVLTSMFTHADFYHLLFNALGIVFIGMAFEQRIGTRPYLLLFFITGFCGTLAFAGLNWGDPFAAVVGASGAISGVLGAFARMFPHERMSLIILFFPLPPMPMWAIVVGYLLLQYVFLSGSQNVAVEAHLGGLVAGYLLAPLVVRLPLHKRVKKMVSQSALKRLATTPELKSIMRRIEEEEIPDVRSAWIEHFLSSAKCPQCGARLKARREGVVCERGHEL
ncbi:MAG: Rhomboid family intrarane serine protease [Candidatus Thermoplasmatota archaeon]|nr:Rhomboid family intrarane serine protease [Candidatus Thermoplasmatota archaeon]